MVIAVTGATGFVGRHLVATLVQRGHRVRALVRAPRRASLALPREVDLVIGSLDHPAALTALCQGAEAVAHLVAIITESPRATFTGVHVDGTRQLLDAARMAGVARIVYVSAVGARPDAAATRYHRTKWQAEELVRASRLSSAILRPSLINGPESVPIRTLARLQRSLPVVPVFGKGDFLMQPVWIGDVALACALALERRDIEGAHELGGPEVMTFENVVRAVGRAVGHDRPLLHIPLPLARLAARLADPLGPLAPITSDQLRMLVEGNTTPANAITSVFEIQPVGFEEGLRHFLGVPPP
ncbi:MAG TPA: NAD(P)H-binding protein [Gemmatimonadales bacterium]|nr:NAD(P)H-binding protein [Gemmatimonadales bacterium]